MTRRLPIRWRLILASWSIASLVAVVLAVTDYVRTRDRLLGQLESTLESKCDEVITVLETERDLAALENFLLIETSYRFSPYTFYYQVSDSHDRVIARSENLGAAGLPAPKQAAAPAVGEGPRLTSELDPTSNSNRRIRLRTERVAVRRPGDRPAAHVIQTAVSLEPLDQSMKRYLGSAALYLSIALGGIFPLLGFVVSQALRPIVLMTEQASRITARNFGGRLALSGSGDELDGLASVLNESLDRVEKSTRSVEQFSSDAAHQLRGPLTRIHGELDLLLLDPRSAPIRGQLESLGQELDHLSRLCTRLLFLARLDGGEPDQSVFEERVDMTELAAELVEQIAPLAHERDVALRCAFEDRVSVLGNRSLLAEAVLNLLHNAVRFSPKGGTVDVRVDRAGDQCWISIVDTGPGIEPSHHERVFQRFFRIPGPGNTESDGAGLGLAIVRGIATAHGGRVGLEQSPGGGCTFRLGLPTIDPNRES